MRPRARRLPWLALLLLAATGCSTARLFPWTSPEAHDPGGAGPAVHLVAGADDLARRGEARAALLAYERVLREHPRDPAAASALYGLGRLQADPSGGVRNYRAALRAFARLLADYPDSRWQAEARAWRAVIADLIAREDEAARLKTQIERLRRTDLDLERRH